MRVVRFIILVAILGWCSSSAPAIAQIDDEDEIIVPNVFTPNNDGDNDYFEVKSENNNPVLLKIYTRMGVLIYSFEARLHAWDGCTQSGQPLPVGVYYYTAEVRGAKGTKYGFVHLYR